MKVLITGYSGFLGQSILAHFKNETIATIGRRQAAVICDLSAQIPQLPETNLVIHAAGKAHMVPKTEAEKQEFFDVNVKGTQNLLKGLEQSAALPKSFVFISSVSVYGLEGNNIEENHPLNAKDPYGLSKIHAEELVQKWCDKSDVICTILRLPLLVGPNAPGNLGAMIRGIRKGYYLNIAGGKARKSMVLAKDVAKFIVRASEVGGIYNLTDGYHPNFAELSQKIANQLGKKTPKDIPLWLASLIAKTGDILGEKAPFNSYKLSKINADLTFDDSKAREAFGWKPTPVLEGFEID